tara:strand:+ start:407 stop:649 length:243 start_codon:yes stop_codon:yes gene_type:complete
MIGYSEYDGDNRITYDEACDAMYIFKAQPQGRIGTVLLYNNEKDGTMASLDTDEVGTIVGIELIGVKSLMKKFAIDNDRN